MKTAPLFATEADLVAAFIQALDRSHNQNPNAKQRWTVYHETGGYDLLLADPDTGVQLGLEAKLKLNLKVINQVLPNYHDVEGPDYRAVLVPYDGVQIGLGGLAEQIGIHVLTVCRRDYWGARKSFYYEHARLPNEDDPFSHRYNHWHSWMPERRVKLPDYVPDVVGGKPSPITLTDWKIRAIKLMILLDRNGHVTRADMRALGISPTRWTASSHGFLVSDKAVRGYVRCGRTPDLRAQHPRNYAEIEADFDTWNAALDEERKKAM